MACATKENANQFKKTASAATILTAVMDSFVTRPNAQRFQRYDNKSLYTVVLAGYMLETWSNGILLPF
jgi:hypothetical protein